MADGQAAGRDSVHTLDLLPVQEHATSDPIILPLKPPAAMFDRSHGRSSGPVRHTLKTYRILPIPPVVGWHL